MSEWYIDGVQTGHLGIDDRAIHYGDGVFETIAIRDGKPRLLPLHLQRLRHSCVKLGFVPPNSENLQRELDQAIAACTVDTAFCVAKIIVSAGSGTRGYKREDSAVSAIKIGLFESTGLGRKAYREGVNSILCETRLAKQPRLAGIKSLNRLEQVLARAEWDDPDVFEGLMRDTDNRPICGTMSNVFIVTNNAYATPALSRCGVTGVMRRHVITLLAHKGTDVSVRDLSMAELRTADEVFLSNSQFGVVPVKSLGNRDWTLGAATRTVMSLLADDGITESECVI